MDVHDVGEYKVGGEWRVLEVGMALGMTAHAVGTSVALQESEECGA